MADATGNTVTVGGDSAGGLRVDAYLPLIEGPATLKTGQVATYRVIAPQALIDSVAYPGAPADSFADPVQWEVDPALTALVPHGPSRPGGMFRGPLTIEVRADRPGKATLDAVIGPGEVAMDVTVLPLELPSITLDGPRELRVGSKGGYIAYPVHAVGPVSWSIDGRQYGDLSPAGAAAVLRALKPGTVVVVAEVQGEGGQVARASERVRIV
ncbi:MAG: hypothetical protein QJR03_16350, partial [Sphaerobacter sp.]|nr:hypothetical protein [Sphaerobacter sp.]